MFGQIKKKLVLYISSYNKKLFIKSWDPVKLNSNFRKIKYQIISFSGEKQFAEQLYSISSFYFNIGTPFKWIIYDDGTLSKESIDVFCKIKNLEIRNTNVLKKHFPEEVLQKHPTLYKVEIHLNHISQGETIYVDSDVLFYNSFNLFLDQLRHGNWYIVDEGKGYFDDDYYDIRNTEFEPLNLGCLIINNPININQVINYINNKIAQHKYSYWTDQSGYDSILKTTDITPLDKKYFITGGNDAFRLSHCVNYKKIAMRHFVGPVRHKMWQYPWKKVLGVK